MRATKLLVIRDSEFASASFTLFHVKPEQGSPLDQCCVFAEHGEVTCPRHGYRAPCVEAVIAEMLGNA